MKSKLTGISLFTGAGGMDVGFHAAGVDVLFANELNHDAASSYRQNSKYVNSEVLHEGDVVQYLSDIDKLAGTDVVFGGPPCQGFSVAGKMDPHDIRSQLIWTFMDVVEAVRPRLFVMENVKALGTLQKWAPVREQLAKRAARLGYGHTMEILTASDYGVPQARERWVFVGIRSASSNKVALKFAREMQSQTQPAPTVREALACLPAYGSNGNNLGSTAQVRLAKNPVIRSTPFRGSLLFNGRGRLVDLDDVSKTLPAQMGGNHTPIIDQSLLENPTGSNWTADYLEDLRRGRIKPGEDQPSVPSTLRRMTVQEAAALQTFPPDFIFSGSYGSQYRQIGNAVPCRFAQAIATSAIATLESLS